MILIGVKRIIILLICLITLFVTPQLYSQTFINGRVTWVSDGDTFTMETKTGEDIEVRLYGVDCPESEWPNRSKAQPGSKDAKQFAIDMIHNKEVTVRLKGENTYNRVVGEPFVNGLSLSRELIKNGWGWWNKTYAKDDQDLKRLEESARHSKLGIWGLEKPAIAPWKHRRGGYLGTKLIYAHFN